MRVQYTDSCLSRYIVQGVTYEVAREYVGLASGKPMYEVICDDGNKRNFMAKRFTIVEEKNMSKRDTDWTEYKFNIRSLVQIDVELIERDLSYAKPIMVVEIPEEPNVIVVLHYSVMDKAGNIVDQKGKLERKLWKLMNNMEHGWGHMPKADLGKVVRLVKKIKQAQWAEGYQAEVTVRRLKV